MSSEHSAKISDQFTRQAQNFAASRELHNEAVLKLLTDAASPRPTDRMLDVACGPGTVVVAFAPLVAHAIGIDATPAMLAEAQKLTTEKGLQNVAWRQGSAYELPFPNESFDIVTSRFTFHHFERPTAVFKQMLRVARRGARIVLCDAVVSEDPAKARAFNEMERWSDPSTIEIRSLGYLKALFSKESLPEPTMTGFQVSQLAHDLVARSFPAHGDRAGLLKLIEQSVDGDLLGMNAHRETDGVHITFQAFVLTATK